VSEMPAYRVRRAPRTEFVTVRGLGHRVLRWGPPDDDPVVLLHGFLDTAETFQFVVDAFEHDWPLLAFDWRGFGDTAWAPGGYWFPDYFADLDALLDACVPGRNVRLVGHSMGGNVALWYAGIRPERVRAVVDLEGFGLPRTDPQEAPSRLQRWLDQQRDTPAYGEYDDVPSFARLLARRNPRLTPERAAFVAQAWTRPLPDGRIGLRADPAHKAINPYLYRRDEADACWRRIAAPVYLLLAEHSEYLPGLGRDGARETFASIIPSLEIEILPGAGHMLHHEQPREVAARVERFLSTHR